MQPDPFTAAAAAVGAPYGMTATDVLAYLAVGERRHRDAPDGECGIVDPRSDGERYWCRLEPGHTGDHCRYTEEELR